MTLGDPLDKSIGESTVARPPQKNGYDPPGKLQTLFRALRRVTAQCIVPARNRSHAYL